MSRRSSHSPPGSQAGVDTSPVRCVPPPLFWGLIYTWLCSYGRQVPRSWSLCSLAPTHISTWPDLLVDEALSLCSGMWGNQSLWGLAWGLVLGCTLPYSMPQSPPSASLPGVRGPILASTPLPQRHYPPPPATPKVTPHEHLSGST